MTAVSTHTRRQKTELNEMWCWVSEQTGLEKGGVLYSKVYFCSAGSRTWSVWLVCDFNVVVAESLSVVGARYLALELRLS